MSSEVSEMLEFLQKNEKRIMDEYVAELSHKLGMSQEEVRTCLNRYMGVKEREPQEEEC